METEILPCELEEEILKKRLLLNRLILNGINEELIEISQELDILINIYTKLQKNKIIAV